MWTIKPYHIGSFVRVAYLKIDGVYTSWTLLIRQAPVQGNNQQHPWCKYFFLWFILFHTGLFTDNGKTDLAQNTTRFISDTPKSALAEELQRTFCAVQIKSHDNYVASFPGRSHLQYLIAYSMQIRSGKAWEIWSRAFTSGRQMVDTWGAVSDSSNSRFMSNRPWCCEAWVQRFINNPK